jgi:M6 family metalloprotease-like protein
MTLHRALRSALLLAILALATVAAQGAGAQPVGHAPPLQPIDPQDWTFQDDMTWDEYRAVPSTNWSDPSLEATVRTFKGALIFGDFPNQPFVATRPPRSTIFGNPSELASGIARGKVAHVYEDFLNTPQPLNHGQTINSYWMEDSLGRFGVDLEAYGPYLMDFNSYQYFMEFQSGTGCPTGEQCNKGFRGELRDKWIADVGDGVADSYDFIFYVSSGQDESSTWQEFGEMMFQTPEDVTDAFGPPDPSLPNWVDTRYIDWTSWAAGSTMWPSAGGGNSQQAESSGMGTYAHEFSHILGIGDNYNNPYGVPPRRSYTGPWDMLSRGTFNGPGGPHTRWQIPPVNGGALGSNHNLRNRMELEIVDEQNVLRLDRNELDESGLVVGTVTARAADPGPDGLTGFNIELGGPGDLSPECEPDEDPFCDGGNFDNYTLEVVDRMGNDSFLPGHGVLISKTKDRDRSPFVWIQDAHPEDIGVVDFVRPDGSPSMLSIGDYRQLNDATFHAGLESGSQYELVDEPNRLHVYVVNVRRDESGVLSYDLAVRSLDGPGPQARGAALANATKERVRPAWAANCNFPLTNTGAAAPPAGAHPEDVSAYVDADVYRLSASLSGEGWSAQLYKALATAEFGETTNVPVYVTRTPGSSNRAVVTLTATSESDPSETATATCNLKISDLNEQ